MSDLRIPDLNTVYIAGRLTRDPDLRYTLSGRAYVRVGMANTRYYKDKSGERKEETVFVNLTAWDKQAEWIGERLRKGRPVLVEGRLRSYEQEDNGTKTTRIEISANRVTPLDWDSEHQPARQPERQPEARPYNRQAEVQPENEDDIPF